MKLSECNVETNNISNLSDKPAITPQELKKKFDEAPSNIKKWLNETLLPEIEKELDSKVTSSKDGYLMTKTEKEKLAGIQEQANKIKILTGTDEPTEEIDADFYVQIFE